MSICMQKNQLHFFRNLGTLGMFGHPHQNHNINLYQAAMLIFMQKMNSSLTFFLRHCKEIANLLFWVIWACLSTHT